MLHFHIIFEKLRSNDSLIVALDRELYDKYIFRVVTMLFCSPQNKKKTLTKLFPKIYRRKILQDPTYKDVQSR
jgi:hypothetical protein